MSFDREQARRLVRNFPENGLKMQMEHPGNVRDVLQLLDVKFVPQIGFDRMEVEPVHYVQRDYRHLEADIVLRAPLRLGRGRKARWITIYILIEPQSEPDRLMVFRVLEYVWQIYRRQVRDWQQEHGSVDHIRFQPVLPVVLYTGTRAWERLTPFAELLEEGVELPDGLTPEYKPLFLNVSQTSAEKLETDGGAFGLLLRLLQQSRLRLPVFEATLRRVVHVLEEQVADADRDRWLALLSYIRALIYHEREKSERETLNRVVDDAVQKDPHRQEVFDMGKTIAEALMEEGEVRGATKALQQTLQELLEEKFRRIPAGVLKRVAATGDVEQLRNWIKASSRARKLADVGIPPLE